MSMGGGRGELELLPVSCFGEAYSKSRGPDVSHLKRLVRENREIPDDVP